MNDLERTEKIVRESIARNMAGHLVTAKHLDGLYRHYRCQTPGTWNFGFDVVTWPGSLCFAGDLGEYLFQREADMIAFMAKVCASDPVDYRYAAEKCRASRGETREFSEWLFRAALREQLRAGRGDPEVKEKIRVIRNDWDEYSDPYGARRLMAESELWGTELPTLTTFSHQFVLCIHAIHWFCQRHAAGEILEETHATAT